MKKCLTCIHYINNALQYQKENKHSIIFKCSEKESLGKEFPNTSECLYYKNYQPKNKDVNNNENALYND